MGVCLTKESNADKVLTSISAFREDLKLLSQLFTLGTALFGFASYTRYEVGRHNRDSYGSEDAADRGDEFQFDHLDGHVVDEAFQSNL